MDTEQKLLDALESLLYMEVKGHALADRLQFSDAGREILTKCLDAIKQAKGEWHVYNTRDGGEMAWKWHHQTANDWVTRWNSE